MKINRLIYLLMMLALPMVGNAAETAKSVLKHAVDRMSDGGVEAQFTVKASGVNGDGSMLLQGKKFRIITNDLSTWYDGKTQWTLAKAVKEVTMIEPTAEELAEINPLIILSNLSSHFDVEMAQAPAGSYKLVLSARSKDAPVTSARVVINGTTWFPSEFDVVTNTGQRFTIKINSIKNINSVNQSAFKFNQASYPGVEVIDLR